MTKKEQMAEDTRIRICNALLTCLNQVPFRKVTVQMIIDSASVNRSTFYKYYTDKYDLMEQYLNQVVNEFYLNTNYDFIKAKSSDIDKPVYSQAFSCILEFFYQNRTAYRVLWNTDIDRNLFQEMVRIHKSNILETIRTDLLYRPELETYAELYSDLFSYNCMMTVRWWLENKEELPLEEVNILMKKNMEEGFFQTYRSLVEGQME